MRAEGDLKLVRLLPGYRTAESFVTIGEHFGRGEHTGGRQVERSQPTERGGYYFLARVRSERALSGARVQVEVILPGSLEPKAFSFVADLREGESVVHLGITGTDWPEAQAAPLAWRLTVRERDGGGLLLDERSFLWAVPPAAAPAS